MVYDLGRCSWPSADRLRVYLGRGAAVTPGAVLRLREIRSTGGVRLPSSRTAAAQPSHTPPFPRFCFASRILPPAHTRCPSKANGRRTTCDCPRRDRRAARPLRSGVSAPRSPVEGPWLGRNLATRLPGSTALTAWASRWQARSLLRPRCLGPPFRQLLWYRRLIRAGWPL